MTFRKGAPTALPAADISALCPLIALGNFKTERRLYGLSLRQNFPIL
jgi:hypothetical protein